MATKVTEKAKEMRKFDLADVIFTKKNEEEGVWVEPVIYGIKIGVMFKVIGSNSEKMTIINDEYDREKTELRKLKDPEARAKEIDRLYVKYAAKRVVGLKCAEDADITIDGEPIEYSDSMVRRIFENSPETAQFIFRYSMDSENFLKKKND